MATADPYEWPKTPIGSKLSILEQSLVCGICSEFYENPHALTCGHSFCSLCIRKHLDRNFNANTFNKCPMCPEKAETSHLRVNRVLESITTNYRVVRDELLEFIKNGSTTSNVTLSNPSSTGQRKETDIKRLIPQKVLHEFNTVPKMKKELLSLCQPSSIPITTDGGLDDLKRKYRNFVAIHNAQVGSLHPMTFSECVQEINRAERARAAEAWTNASSSSKIEKLRSGELVPDAQAQFLELVKNAKKRKQTNVDQPEALKVDGSVSDEVVKSEEVVVKTLKFIMTGTTDTPNAVGTENGVDAWQVKWSEKLGCHFFLNTKTMVAQFVVPPELVGVDFSCLVPTASSHSDEVEESPAASKSMTVTAGGRKRGRRVEESPIATQAQVPSSQSDHQRPDEPEAMVETVPVNDTAVRVGRPRRGQSVTTASLTEEIAIAPPALRSAQKKPRGGNRRSLRIMETSPIASEPEIDVSNSHAETFANESVQVSALETAPSGPSAHPSSQHSSLPQSQYDGVMRTQPVGQSLSGDTDSPSDAAGGGSCITDDEKKRLLYAGVSNTQIPTQAQVPTQEPTQETNFSFNPTALPGAPVGSTQAGFSVDEVDNDIEDDDDDDDEPVLVSDDVSPPSQSSSSASTSWNCSHCTYLNPPTLKLCEICDQARFPLPTNANRSSLSKTLGSSLTNTPKNAFSVLQNKTGIKSGFKVKK